MKNLNIDILALDLAVCDRCGGTLANLKAALRIVQPVLSTLGIVTNLTETLIESEVQADRLRFVSSPTIRINGHDVIGELRETSCGVCSDLSGAVASIDCRVWPWKGVSHDAAPVGLIVEAILNAALHPALEKQPAKWSGVPENILTFLKGKKAKSSCDSPSETGACSCSCAH